MHLRVAKVLENMCTAGRSAEYLQVAVHYENAGQFELAVPYYEKAGLQALYTYSTVEAEELFRKALELLLLFPETQERNLYELDLQLKLATPVIQLGISVDYVGSIYRRALTLCDRVCDDEKLFEILAGMRKFTLVRCDFAKAKVIGERLVAHAERLSKTTYRIIAYSLHAETLLWMGILHESRRHFMIALEPVDQKYYHQEISGYIGNYSISPLVFGAYTDWSLGYPDQALVKLTDAILLADEVNHPYLICIAQYFGAILYRMLGDWHMSKELAESAFQVANDNAITHFGAFSESLLGWLLAKQGTLREGLGMLQKGMDINYETGNLVELVNQFCMLAEVYYQIEEYQNALHSLDDALERIDQTGERYLLSEVYRIRGDVLLMMQKDGEAERAYMNAIETARQQEARMFELRASTSLARLWHKQGKRTEAKKLLQAIYDWFTEGFDTVDLKKARELLELLV